MKTILTRIAAAVFLLLPTPASAAYVIHLKDGTRFVTDQYYEEGDQIKFKRYGGLIGIEKDRVLEIEETKDVPVESRVRSETGVLTDEGKTESGERSEVGVVKPEAAGPVEERKEKTADGKTDREKAEQTVEVSEEEKISEEQDRPRAEENDAGEHEAKDQIYYQKKKVLLETELRDALKKYKDAKALGQEEKVREQFRRASRLSIELEELRKEVKRNNFGFFPAWWDSPS